ncbi:2-C-methyl-D-erythritol 4-phosphate cytidylyltransferase / 2-C-methyl-D-erythritol 2,4-cyclodiphosphate synthase [Limimaricola cinnabarinus LL-001]|uniref:2-C-methyl-D-erythritol 4-phosphate cytidylyltransferase / 2-C-methyl-D-erythritol 2,4-cyclodiphosphate synthase n=1 Tax=Limimaricola cinnabarinus LL-001 TaxID=1337093 RepID=U3AFG6_9RHOB|nr:2-C-methyl-D-erythritol 4-phosphate cytidylyltransferase / 2-C-methyl-D-erythritol 2,4-cyclodiphosphate synthase [Limimaricola cinnabarinus LL-001]
MAKQWRYLGGRTVLARSIAAFAGLGPICLVLREEEIGRHPRIEAQADLVVAGGAERAHSVRAGLEALVPLAPERVLIHDAARPLVPRETIRAVIAALDHGPAAAPGLVVTDALWRIEDGRVVEAPSRDGWCGRRRRRGSASTRSSPRIAITTGCLPPTTWPWRAPRGLRSRSCRVTRTI